MSRFSGISALVTGGSSGIGLAVVRRLAAEGARVTFCGRGEPAGRSAETALQAEGLEVRFVRCDVADEADIAQLFQTHGQWAGGLDIAVNSAGLSPLRASLVDSTVETYGKVFSVNVLGTFLALREEMRAMQKTGGAIINIASVLGLRALNLNHALYTASKHAVVGLTKTAALEGAPRNIRVNAVCPGGVDTPIHRTNSGTAEGREKLAAMHPLKRLATAEEVASAVAYLACPDAGFVTGSIFSIDGGASIV